jgi:sulfonate transport system ATP-binding protein
VATSAAARRPAPPVLDVHVVAKHHDARRILRDVRLTLAPGEIVAIVGASGCGKSTLLRIVAGLDRDYAGSVRLDGIPQSAPSRAVGFVFQEPRLFPWCRVSDNVAFEAGGALRRDARVDALLQEVGLAGHGGALPRQLSGGQAQRVALARALYGAPRVLLLDEPFSAVDAFTRLKLQEVLLGLVQRHQVAALLVTHDIDEAVALADRVLVFGADPGHVRDAIAVTAPRPRRPGDAAVAALRGQVVDALHAARAL